MLKIKKFLGNPIFFNQNILEKKIEIKYSNISLSLLNIELPLLNIAGVEEISCIQGSFLFPSSNHGGSRDLRTAKWSDR